MLGEKLDSEERDESLWKTPDASHSTAASSLEDRRTLPLLGRTGTPVMKDAPVKKNRRRRRKKPVEHTSTALSVQHNPVKLLFFPTLLHLSLIHI